MQFDDRLATVLRMRTGSMAGVRTQFRQLLDLLGSAPSAAPASALSGAGFQRLAQLAETIPPAEQVTILREAGLRLRNPRLVLFLAEREPRPAAAALATARLTESEWEALIPRLSLVARGFLRHRRDLPAGATRLLGQLGVQDMVLSDGRIADNEPGEAVATCEAEPMIAPQPRAPSSTVAAPAGAPEPVAPAPRLRADWPRPLLPRAAAHIPASELRANGPIGEIIERIEQFREQRRIPVLSPRLPLGDLPPAEAPAPIDNFDCVTDASGEVVWASGAIAPLVVGLALTCAQSGPLVNISGQMARALRQRQPVHWQPVTLMAAPAISGDWRLLAAPVFADDNGGFAGYRCRLRRAGVATGAATSATASAAPDADTPADRVRQALHELRTPVNAIQGFAEIIQQQVFGPAPHEYRAHAAAIASDAATLMAGLDELGQLAALEAGTCAPEEGACDLAQAIRETVKRLEPVLAARNAGFDPFLGEESVEIALARPAALAICWRLLASAAASLAPGERVAIILAQSDSAAEMALSLPAGLQSGPSKGATPPAAAHRRSAVSAGLFGPQFAFRLAEAEARAAGGSLEFAPAHLTLALPVLTRQANAAHSNDRDELRA